MTVNNEPARTLEAAAAKHGGVELPDQAGFQFDSASSAAKAAAELGATVELPVSVHHRTTVLRPGKENRLVAEVSREEGDVMPGWISHKTRKVWIKVFDALCDQRGPDEQLAKVDDFVRLVEFGKSDVWYVRRKRGLCPTKDPSNVWAYLRRMGYSDPTPIKGTCVSHTWQAVNIPFGPEYPSGRRWNIDAAQLRYTPIPGPHPHWDRITRHIGSGLDPALQSNEWAKANGIDGAGYIVRWIASMVRHPFDPLPYLALVGEQNSGKSILHESIKSCLLTPEDVVAQADRSLLSDFNGELAHAILAFVEEVDLSRKGTEAYSKIKDWVTSPTIAIRRLFYDQYQQPNTTHWIQCANHLRFVPVFPGDSRITLIFVPALIEEIPKRILLDKLREEGPQFTSTLLTIPLPPLIGRLRLPVIHTATKRQAIRDQSPIAAFVEDRCDLQGVVEKATLFDEWESWRIENERDSLSREHFSQKLMSLYPAIEPGKMPRDAAGKRPPSYQGISLRRAVEC